MIILALRRMRRGRKPLGAWTPSLILAATTTVVLSLTGLFPGNLDTDHYWLAWLGEKILQAHAVPHTLGPESPLDVGRPWIAQEWLTAVLIALARDSHVFPWLAAAMGACWSLIAWIALGECVRRRVGPSITFFAVLQAALVCNLRFMPRAEDFGILMLALAYWTAESGRRRLTWICLPVIFLLWANLHASFFLGFGACAYAFARQRARWGLGPLALGIAATFATPFGPQLWGYALWLPHSWVRSYVEEWLPTWNFQPSVLPGLLIPLLAIGRRANWRRLGALDAGIWLATATAAVMMTRWGAIAAAFGIPAGSAAVRMRDPREPGVGNATLGVALAILMTIPIHLAHLRGSGGVAPDPDFGLIMPRNASEFTLMKAPLEGKLAWCPITSDCSIALLHGAKTLVDARIDPFPEHRVAVLATNPRAITCFPELERVITPALIKPENLGLDWEVRRYGWTYVYSRDAIKTSSKSKDASC